jgi:hypothetical protein
VKDDASIKPSSPSTYVSPSSRCPSGNKLDRAVRIEFLISYSSHVYELQQQAAAKLAHLDHQVWTRYLADCHPRRRTAGPRRSKFSALKLHTIQTQDRKKRGKDCTRDYFLPYESSFHLFVRVSPQFPLGGFAHAARTTTLYCFNFAKVNSQQSFRSPRNRAALDYCTVLDIFRVHANHVPLPRRHSSQFHLCAE